MRRTLWATAAAALVGLAVPAAAGEPNGGILERGREVVQACFHRHCEAREEPCASPCDSCSEDDVKIGKWICELESSPKACERMKAVGWLNDYNWQQHPEIVVALTHAMQSDCDPCVRRKAAASLKCMKACDPDVVGAMRFSAEADPSWWVRCKARGGTKKLENCQPPCLEFVSSYSPSCSSSQPDNSRLEPVPAPRPMGEPKSDPSPDKEHAKRGTVRSLLSTAVAKVKSRS